LSSRKGISSISFQHYDLSYGATSGEGRVLWPTLCIFNGCTPGKIHMKSLNTFVHNMERPKGSMGKGYIMEDAIGFCTKYMQRFQTMEQ